MSRRWIILLLVALAAGCTPAADEQAAEPAAPDLARTMASVELVDLTHPLSPDSIYWPTGSPFEHERLSWGINDAGYFYAAARFSSPEHLGTHLDAPVHFAEEGWTSADIPVQRFVAPVALVDISERAAADADALLEAEDLVAWENAHGQVPAGAVVLVRAGWSERWPDWNAYYGSETPEDVTTLHFPGVSQDAARALVERGVAGVGIDTASIDPGVSQTFEAHRILAAADIYNLENLVGLDAVPASGAWLAALPMKIAGGTGGPARVVALVPR